MHTVPMLSFISITCACLCVLAAGTAARKRGTGTSGRAAAAGRVRGAGACVRACMHAAEASRHRSSPSACDAACRQVADTGSQPVSVSVPVVGRPFCTAHPTSSPAPHPIRHPYPTGPAAGAAAATATAGAAAGAAAAARTSAAHAAADSRRRRMQKGECEAAMGCADLCSHARLDVPSTIQHVAQPRCERTPLL